LQLTRIYAQRGVQKALKYLKGRQASAGKEQKIDAATIRHLARGLVEAKKISDGIDFLRAGIKMFPKNHALHQILGALYMITGKNKQGHGHLQTSLKLKPSQERELNSLGYTLMAGRYHAAALAIFKLNVATYPQSANCYDSLAEAYMRTGNSKMAIKYYQLTLTRIPHDTRASKTTLASLKQGAEANLKRLKSEAKKKSKQ
jgi:predicted Zn-dependent protease